MPSFFFVVLRLKLSQPANTFAASATPSNPVTAVRWVPSSHNLFLAAYADGTMVVYDRDREDGPFAPKEPHGPEVPLSTPKGNVVASSNDVIDAPDDTATTEWDPLYDIFVTPNPLAAGANEKSLRNPVSHWRVSKRRISGKLMIYKSMDFLDCSDRLRFFS